MSRNYTPLRYPGGKQRLSPFVLEILKCNNLLGGIYVEPYAGGAGVAIDLLLSQNVCQIHLNDSAYEIFSFWKAILTEPEEFCRRIALASLDVDEWKMRREIVRQSHRYDFLKLASVHFI
jgi:DNA adenine methylase